MYNSSAQIFEAQVVIRDSATVSSSTSGGLLVEGGVSAKDTYVVGHVAVNDVKITPNLNDILYEQQFVLANTGDTWTDIENFIFQNEYCNAFKAIISVNVGGDNSKYSLWEINAVLIGSNWTYNASYTGNSNIDVDFKVKNHEANGKKFAMIQYLNKNNVTTTIRYRASTSGTIGHSPTSSEKIFIENRVSDTFMQNTLYYAQGKNSVGYASGVTYTNNTLNVSNLSSGNSKFSTITTGALYVDGVRITANGGGASSWVLSNSDLSYTSGNVNTSTLNASSLVSTGTLHALTVNASTINYL